MTNKMRLLIKKAIYANSQIAENNLSLLNFGNASVFDPEELLIAIKPSGMTVSEVTYENIVVTNLNGIVIYGNLKPSVDVLIHSKLYQRFKNIRCIIHIHSHWTSIWSQIGMDIPILGTTHADFFKTSIPCTRMLSEDEINFNYENNISKIILQRFNEISYEDTPAILLRSHGAFTWGKNEHEAVKNAIVLEFISMTAWHTYFFNSKCINEHLIAKHFYRKNGDKKYYGQY